MKDPNTIRMNAMSIGSGEAIGQCAMAICYERNQDPFAYASNGMPVYQAIIFEILMGEEIKRLAADRWPQ